MRYELQLPEDTDVNAVLEALRQAAPGAKVSALPESGEASARGLQYFFPLPGQEQAFSLGLQDGIAQPLELQDGRTWEDSRAASESYDNGVNLGQLLGWALQPELWEDRPQPLEFVPGWRLGC